MRKLIIALLSYLIIISPIKVFAASNVSVETKVLGEVKKGSNIEILVDVKNVDNLYAASIDFTYDIKQLKVESISATDYITKNIDNIMELGGETDKNGNIATYSFTFLGDVDGLMGSGTLVKITAKVLNNDKLSITKDNMKIKLVQKADGTVKNYSYNFLGYNTGSNSDTSNGSGSSGGSNSNGNESSESNNEGNGSSSSNGDSSGNSNSSGNNGSSGGNTSSNNKSDSSQTNDNKISNNNSNDKSNSESTGENDAGNTAKEEVSSDSKANGINRKDTSKDEEESSESSNSNFSIILYILIPVVIIGGAGFYYYKSRKNRNKDK